MEKRLGFGRTEKEKEKIEKKTNRIERKYLPELIYGGTDGVITTFAVVAGVLGALLSPAIVLILGFANIFSDGFAIAVSSYFSVRSRNELIKNPEKDPVKTAAATFFSFVVMGLIPLISFLIAFITKNPILVKNQFIYSIILTGASLAVIGGFKGKVTGKAKLKSALQTLLIGGIAAFLAFLVGKTVSIILG